MVYQRSENSITTDRWRDVLVVTYSESAGELLNSEGTDHGTVVQFVMGGRVKALFMENIRALMNLKTVTLYIQWITGQFMIVFVQLAQQKNNEWSGSISD